MIVFVLAFVLLLPLSLAASWFLICRARPAGSRPRIELPIVEVPLPAVTGAFTACLERETEAACADKPHPRDVPCEVHHVKPGEPCPEGEAIPA